MKKFTFKNVLDGFRSSVTQPTAKPEQASIVETLRPEFFQIIKTVRHGFPYQPTCLTFDPIQKLLAVGTKHGSIRLIGRPGVDVHLQHEADVGVIQVVFLPNEGALVDATQDDVIHLWNFRQKKAEIVHSLKFQRERITCIHLPFQSKWLYVGTERGNIHVVNIEVFQLSGYIINWNKAIELSRKTHPGSVVHLSDCPVDPSKLLIGYETGQIVIWDLKSRIADARYQSPEPLRSISWHFEGKQFMCSHTDGSLTTWGIKQTLPKPTSTIFPHAKTNKEGKQETCKTIQKVEWTCSKNEDSFVIFSGGLINDFAGRTPSITVIHGKTTTVLEMEHTVVDFTTLRETPYVYEFGEPYALVVLLHNDIVVVDLQSEGYPCFENPYSMDLHESPVTSCSYIADCPADLIPALYPIGARSQKRVGFSDKEWPISGGEWGSTSCSYSEMIVTGHADGSLKFWDASSVSFQILYKLKTAKLFEKPRTKSLDGDDDPFAVQHIALCPESRILCIAGATAYVIFFKFSKQETSAEIPCMEIPIVYDNNESGTASPECEFPPQVVNSSPIRKSRKGLATKNKINSVSNSMEYFVSIHVRGGIQKKAPGYQAEFVCLTPWVNGEPPGQITALTVNSSYGLLAYGNESGLVIIDYIQKCCLLNMGTPELYGMADPYQRGPKSPKRIESSKDKEEERSKSPSSDQEKVDNDENQLDRKAKLATKGEDKAKKTTSKIVEDSGNGKSENRLSTGKQSDNRLDIMKYLRKDKSRSMSREDSIISPKGKDEDLDTQVKMKSEDNSHSSSLLEEHSTYEEAIKDVNDLPESLFIVDDAEEAKETVEDEIESTGDDPPGDDPPGDDPPNSQESNPETSTDGESKTPRELRSAKSTGYVEKKSKSKLRNQLSKLDAKVRRAFSLEHGNHNEMLPTDFDPESLEEVKLRLPDSEHEAVSPEIGETDDAKHNIPLLFTHSPSTSQSPSPRISPGINAKPTSVDKNVENEHLDDRANVEPIKSSKLSLELFDNDGNPIPPVRRKTCQGHDQDAKFLQSAAGCPQGSSPKGSAPGSWTPTDDLNRMEGTSANLTSPSNVGTFKSFFSQITKKGSSQVSGDKLDGSTFSRSRSSSISSLDNITSEAIQCLAFADSYSKKNETQLCPTLWVGTKLGSVIQVMVFIPTTNETRLTSPVTVAPSGTIFRLKGSILAMSFLDCNGALIPYTFESWKDAKKEARKLERTPTKTLVNNRMSPTGFSGGEQTWGDRQFVVIATDKVARVVALPSHNCVYKQIITEVSFVVKAEIIQMKDAVCLVCYNGTGHISIFSLPSLRQLLYMDFLPLVDLSFQMRKRGIVDPMLSIWGQQMFVTEDANPIAKTFCFTNYGHGLYLCSPTEIQKFTISSEFVKDLQELVATLFRPTETPEPPKQSFGFLKGFFGGGVSQLDREELFGESSGKACRSVAKHVTGPNAQLENLNVRSGTVAGEVLKTKMQLVERGEKLGQLDDRTAKMMNESESFSNSAHNLMQRYKDKKWYQI